MDDVASLESASAGHDVVFSMQMPSADDTERRQALNIATATRRAGVTQSIHSSVSGTGWQSQYPDFEVGDAFIRTYWEQKEAAEEVVRQAGFDRWTLLKPAFFMDNYRSPKQEVLHPDLAQDKLVTAVSPQTVLALISADDFGAAVAAAVADPDRFHQAELAGDALTHGQIAATLSEASGREIKAVFISREEQEQRAGSPVLWNDIWIDRVGYPARPSHADSHDLTTTTFDQWAAKQDWSKTAG